MGHGTAEDMKLYLVQHGEAEPKTRNPERPLTEHGRLDVSRVAAFARVAGIDVHQILHSGLRRASETARIFAQELEPEAGMAARPGLAPRDDAQPIARLVNSVTYPLMIVGHGPFMERLVGLLLAGNEGIAVVRFTPGGIVCLERIPGTSRWHLLWTIVPGLFPWGDCVDR